MMRFADKVPERDKGRILDLFYGRNSGKLAENLGVEDISKKLNGKYTPAQIRSVIRADIDKAIGEEYGQE